MRRARGYAPGRRSASSRCRARPARRSASGARAEGAFALARRRPGVPVASTCGDLRRPPRRCAPTPTRARAELARSSACAPRSSRTTCTRTCSRRGSRTSTGLPAVGRAAPPRPRRRAHGRARPRRRGLGVAFDGSGSATTARSGAASSCGARSRRPRGSGRLRPCRCPAATRRSAHPWRMAAGARARRRPARRGRTRCSAALDAGAAETVARQVACGARLAAHQLGRPAVRRRRGPARRVPTTATLRGTGRRSSWRQAAGRPTRRRAPVRRSPSADGLLEARHPRPDRRGRRRASPAGAPPASARGGFHRPRSRRSRRPRPGVSRGARARRAVALGGGCSRTTCSTGLVTQRLTRRPRACSFTARGAGRRRRHRAAARPSWPRRATRKAEPPCASGVPGKVTEVYARTACSWARSTSAGSAARCAWSTSPRSTSGTYVVVHVGFAISVVDEAGGRPLLRAARGDGQPRGHRPAAAARGRAAGGHAR